MADWRKFVIELPAVVASYTTQHLVETGRGMEASKLIAATKTKEGMEKMKQDNDAANMEISKQIEALKSEFRRSRTTNDKDRT